MRFPCILFAVILACLVITPPAFARRFASNRSGKQVVVHTRIAPVMAHRVVPPFHGKHVYTRSTRPNRRRSQAR